MNLKNDFYEVLAADKDAATPAYHIHLKVTHKIFKAHFPGEPVTPGVCLIQIGKELAEDCLGKKLRIRLLKNVKFLSVVSPLQTSECWFRINKKTTDNENGQIAVQLTADADGTQLLKMSMVCTVL